VHLGHRASSSPRDPGVTPQRSDHGRTPLLTSPRHVLALLREVCAAGTGVLVASHDPAVVAADRPG